MVNVKETQHILLTVFLFLTLMKGLFIEINQYLFQL